MHMEAEKCSLLLRDPWSLLTIMLTMILVVYRYASGGTGKFTFSSSFFFSFSFARHKNLHFLWRRKKGWKLFWGKFDKKSENFVKKWKLISKVDSKSHESSWKSHKKLFSFHQNSQTSFQGFKLFLLLLIEFKFYALKSNEQKKLQILF